MNEAGIKAEPEAGERQAGPRHRFSYLWGLLAVAVLYLAMAVAFSQVTPFNKGPDEGYHLEYITFLKQHGRLPITYTERAQITRADFPPLYQLLVAALSARVSVEGPPDFKIFWNSFRYRAMDLQAERVWTISTEDYQWPYVGRFLVWQIGRWLSILFSLATVIVTFFALQAIPVRPAWPVALTGAALLAFIPQYVFLGSALNDDNLLGLFAALYFWLLIKAIKQPERWGPFIGMGILLGLAMTVKYTLVVIPLEVLAVCLLIARSKGWGWRWLGSRLGLVGGLMLLGSSWWFGWNLWFLNTVDRDGWFVGLLSPIMAGGYDTTLNRISGFVSGGQIGLTQLPEDTVVGTFPQWLRSTFLSFWGVNISGAIPFFPYVYLVIGLLLVMAGWGGWRLWQTEPAARKWLGLLLFHTSLFLILPLVRFALTRRLSVTAQGRHILIPAAIAVMGLLVWGLATIVPLRWQRWGAGLLIAGLIAWTGAHLYRLATTAPPPLPLRTLPQAAGWLSHPSQAKFDNRIELVSYDLAPQPEHGLLELSLAWRSLAYANESYLLKVSLLDAQGRLVAYWLGYHGQGRLPSLTWEPGDAIFDRLALPLPNLPAGLYTVRLQLISQAGPLAVSAGEEVSSATFFTLTELSLDQPAVLPLPQQVELTGPAGPGQVAFTLWQAAGPFTPTQDSLAVYRYPATIGVIVPPTEVLSWSQASLNSNSNSQLQLDVYLVDPAGQTWPATQHEANIYTFVIGPRWPSGAYRVQMTLRQGEQTSGQGVSEPLIQVENWWERRFVAPAMASPVEANFANQLKFLGYELPQRQVRAGEAFPLTLYWQALPDQAPQANFIQFNNLLDSAGTLRGGYDRLPLEYYSTLLWAPGEVVIDGYAVPVEAGAPPGQYYLNVGYYLTVGESAVNLPLVVDGQMTGVSSVTIGPIEVVRP